jgi:hypothetical protein
MNETRNSGPPWWPRLHALPRSAVLGFCAALLAALQTVFALVNAPVWLRVSSAVLIAAVAVTSEVDKLQTRRREQQDKELEAAEASAAAEAQWQRQARDSLRLWPAPTLGDADTYALGSRRPTSLAGTCPRAKS